MHNINSVQASAMAKGITSFSHADFELPSINLYHCWIRASATTIISTVQMESYYFVRLGELTCAFALPFNPHSRTVGRDFAFRGRGSPEETSLEAEAQQRGRGPSQEVRLEADV